MFPQLRINLTDDVYARHVSIARKTNYLLSLFVINNALQIVREKEITNDGKWENGSLETRRALDLLLREEQKERIKRNFYCYSIICSIISSFYIVIDSVTRSSRVYIITILYSRHVNLSF